MAKNGIIRTIYLYLFSIVGLVLIIVSGVRFIDMGLKAFIFTQADEEQKFYYNEAPYRPVAKEKISENEGEQVCLSEEESQAVIEWSQQYEEWKNQRTDFDYITTRRHRDASISLAMLLIGLPVYLYHWGTIKKDIKRSKEA